MTNWTKELTSIDMYNALLAGELDNLDVFAYVRALEQRGETKLLASLALNLCIWHNEGSNE